MYIKQLSVFVENKHGSACDIMEILSANSINILTLSIADTTDFGIMRLIVDKPALAEKVIRDAGVVCRTTRVIAVAVDHTPGELTKILQVLKCADLSVEYLYAFCVEEHSKPIIVLRPTHREPALKALTVAGFEIITIDQE